MTQRALDQKAAHQITVLQGWIARAVTLIDGKVADAAAHAARAITDTLRATPDGRATIRRANRSPSYNAAVHRLDELWESLAGPSAASRSGLIRDARAAFYADSFEAWKPFIPDRLWVSPDPQPTQSRLTVMRGAVIHGLDLRREIGGTMELVKRRLSAAVTLAARQDTPDRTATNLIKDWERQSVASLVAVTKLALSDSQMAADVMAGRDLVHPDFLDDSPPTLGA